MRFLLCAPSNDAPPSHPTPPREKPKSKTHKEIALQVLQNIANNDKTPMQMIEYDGLIKSVISVVAGDAFEGVNDVARTNAWLTLQNISFITECRDKLFYFPGCFDAITGVLDNKEDNVKKNALPVCLNVSLATNIREDMLNHSTFIPSLLNIAGNEEGIVREKALSILRNVANHDKTRGPMFEFPGLIDTLLSVINKPLTTESKAARETALSVCQNVANNTINPSKVRACGRGIKGERRELAARSKPVANTLSNAKHKRKTHSFARRRCSRTQTSWIPCTRSSRRRLRSKTK